jgi:hypothetical protein
MGNFDKRDQANDPGGSLEGMGGAHQGFDTLGIQSLLFRANQAIFQNPQMDFCLLPEQIQKHIGHGQKSLFPDKSNETMTRFKQGGFPWLSQMFSESSQDAT